MEKPVAAVADAKLAAAAAAAAVGVAAGGRNLGVHQASQTLGWAGWSRVLWEEAGGQGTAGAEEMQRLVAETVHHTDTMLATDRASGPTGLVVDTGVLLEEIPPQESQRKCAMVFR